MDNYDEELDDVVYASGTIQDYPPGPQATLADELPSPS